MRSYVIIKRKGEHSEIINSSATSEELRALLDKMYKFYDIYTTEPATLINIKKFTDRELAGLLRSFNYHTIRK